MKYTATIVVTGTVRGCGLALGLYLSGARAAVGGG
jgi:hypothetical protein